MDNEELDVDSEIDDSKSEAIPEEITVKDQISQLISAIKESVEQEINYFKARTGYSISMLLRGVIAFFIAIIFIMVAFISLGVGILFILKPMIGIVLATIITVVIFLTLSFVMILFGRSYFKRLSFPELADHERLIEDIDNE